MKYTTAKLSLAMSLYANMDNDVLEQEFEGSKAKMLNYLFWGDKDCDPLKNEMKALEYSDMYYKEK
jgi:hypothetical protein